MINIKGIDYYTAKEITEELQIKYSSVISILRKNNFPKYKRNYIVSKEQLEKLKKRKQTTKEYILTDEWYKLNFEN